MNYDTLLEQSIQKLVNLDFADGFPYLRTDQNWSVFKLHGSIKWGYHWLPSTVPYDLERAYAELTLPVWSRADINVNADHYEDSDVYYPALALPVAGKYGFVCPMEMEVAAAQFLRDCRAYFFVGFGAMDRDVLEFLSANAIAPEVVEVVAGQDAEDVWMRVVQNVPQFANVKPGIRLEGFTSFLERDFNGAVQRVLAAYE